MAALRNYCLKIISIVFIIGARSSHSYVSSASGNGRFFGDKQYSVTESSLGRAVSGELIFQEEFNALNLDTWSHEISMGGGGNDEFQIFTNNRSNSFVKYGKLYIRPTLTADKYGEDFLTKGSLHLGGGGPADQCTNPLFDGCSRYGKLEMRAKLCSGDWMWPTISLLPKSNQYGSWPASGEIDFLEGRGNRKLYDADGTHIGVEQVAQTLHFGPFHPLNAWQKAHFEKNSPEGRGFNENFHLYQLEWTPEFMKFSIDNEDIASVNPSTAGFWELGGFDSNLENPWRFADNPKMAPFDQQFYFSIGVAVGGTNAYFPDSSKGPYKKSWKNDSPQAMRDFWADKKHWYPSWKDESDALVVDYIRVWAL